MPTEMTSEPRKRKDSCADLALGSYLRENTHREEKNRRYLCRQSIIIQNELQPRLLEGYAATKSENKHQKIRNKPWEPP